MPSICTRFSTHDNRISRAGRLLRIPLIAALLTGIFSACENPITGYGPQPSFLDDEGHEPMLNVFGVLRPGTQNGRPLSFAHLEGVFSVLSEYPDSLEIIDAEVTLFHRDGDSAIDSVSFAYTDFDAAFATFEYRPPDFFPLAGHTYGLRCRRAGYPELTSETTVPSPPRILENSLGIGPESLSFAISRDPLTSLYDVFLQIGQQEYSTRVLRPESGDIQVQLDYEAHSAREGRLSIYAYDLNLSAYLTTTVIVKPNTFQPNYSTVEGGHGSFGSLNLLEMTVIF